MDTILGILGWALVLAVAFDFAATTLSVSFVRGTVARAVTRVARVVLRRGPAVLTHTMGPLTVVAVILTWFGLAGIGWAMATAWLRAGGPLESYVASMSTMAGGADPAVAATAGRLGQAVLTGQHLYGLALLSLALAWLLPVVSTVAARRGLAARTNLLLDGGLDWLDGGAHLQLLAVAQDLVEIAERHRAYPVLHAFRTTSPTTSLPVALARLDRLAERLELEQFDAATLRLLDRGLRHFVAVHGEAFSLRTAALDERRAMVDRLCRDAGWDPDDRATVALPAEPVSAKPDGA